jgi:hypothetical protein
VVTVNKTREAAMAQERLATSGNRLHISTIHINSSSRGNHFDSIASG